MSASAVIAELPEQIRSWAVELGFADAGCASLDLDEDLHHLQRWLEQGHHGSMQYMAADPQMRAEPSRLNPGTVGVISARMDYLQDRIADSLTNLDRPERAYVARYALGRDYHKLIRKRLKKLADRIAERIGPHGYRVLTDSAPSLEKALARNARLGWIGKNTLLLNRHAGSTFFLGEIYTDFPLPQQDQAPQQNHCGSCSACMDVCPTKAFVGPYQLDARRCIAYLTIENKGPIPLELRPLMGNRIFGCDDCQLVCPWNRYAQISPVADFKPRHQLHRAELLELWHWDEEKFLKNTEGMALRRAGWHGWLRNLAVALGNAPASQTVLQALSLRAEHEAPMVREHVSWAMAQQRDRLIQTG